MKNIRNTIADMVKSFLTDPEIMTERVKEQITKACVRNDILTTCYMLQVADVQDIVSLTRNDSANSGWYITLSGTRCEYKFFVNNDMEIVRKPNKNKVRVVETYSLYNHPYFDGHFWLDNFAE